MSIAGAYSFSMQRGASFRRTFTRTYQSTGLTAIPVGYQARAQFRTSDGATGTTTATTLLLSLDEATDPASIAVSNQPTGEVTLVLDINQVLLLCPTNVKTKVSYGLELYDDSTTPETVIPFLQGRSYILPETAR